MSFMAKGEFEPGSTLCCPMSSPNLTRTVVLLTALSTFRISVNLLHIFVWCPLPSDFLKGFNHLMLEFYDWERKAFAASC